MKRVILRFDSNCSARYAISMSHWQQERIVRGVPRELVRECTLTFLRQGKAVHSVHLEDNYQRLRNVELEEAVACDAIRLSIQATNGVQQARVFQMEAYGE